MNKKPNTNLGRNSEFGFLYKKLSIRPSVISKMVFVPEYLEALKTTTKDLNDITVYEILKETFVEMCNDGKDYRTARDVMNKVSKDVMGDSSAWKD